MFTNSRTFLYVASVFCSLKTYPFRLVQLFETSDSSLDLKTKCHGALKLCLQNCLLVSALEPLLSLAPPDILKYVLGQYSKVRGFIQLPKLST